MSSALPRPIRWGPVFIFWCTVSAVSVTVPWKVASSLANSRTTKFDLGHSIWGWTMVRLDKFLKFKIWIICSRLVDFSYLCLNKICLAQMDCPNLEFLIFGKFYGWVSHTCSDTNQFCSSATGQTVWNVLKC